MSKNLFYKEFQFAWWILILVVLWLVLTYLHYSGSPAISWNTYLSSTITLLALSLLFYGMKTEIDNSIIKLSFGIGLISKKIQLNNVKSVEVVRNKWYQGWGIRLIDNGWLYNISGLNAVEINQKDKRSIIRIGSQQPADLRKAIFEGITKN